MKKATAAFLLSAIFISGCATITVYVGTAVQTAKGADSISRPLLEWLFEEQMETLRNRGCPSWILGALWAKREQVIKKTLVQNTVQGRIPFVPVIPRSNRGLSDPISLIRTEGAAGIADNCYLDLKNRTAAEEPYFIFDVDEGDGNLGQDPVEVEKTLIKSSRRGLTADEVIALELHSGVVKRHQLAAVDSRTGQKLPILYLLNGVQARLRCSAFETIPQDLGTPSCSDK